MPKLGVSFSTALTISVETIRGKCKVVKVILCIAAGEPAFNKQK